MQVFSNISSKNYVRRQSVSSKIGTTENLGDYLYDWFTQGTGGPVDVIGSSFGVLENAEEGVVQVYDELGIEPPTYESTPVFIPVQSFVHGANENEVYWFHPDHLGSTSYITNLLGEVSQHMEYFAFGETFVEEHRSSNNSPYKFNGKELDEETGWYYYGARYYDPRISVWLSVDPLTEETMTPYQYTYQNPLRYIDPTGMAAEDNDDWYFDNNDNSFKYDPHLTKDNASTRLKEGQSWAGEEVYSDNGIRANKDGSLTNLKTGKNYSGGEFIKYDNGYGTGPIFKSYAKYEFTAGETVDMDIVMRTLIDVKFLGGVSSLTISNKEETISTNYEYSTPSSGLSAGKQYASLFLKTHSSKVKFHQNVSGNNLMEIFGQTDEVSNTTIGSVIYYNNIQGNKGGKLFWEAHQKGHGLSTPLSGTIIPTKPNFKIIK